MRRWKPGNGSSSALAASAQPDKRRFSIGGAKQSPEFVEEVRKNQRRDTITLGKSHTQDLWAKQQGFREYRVVEGVAMGARVCSQ